jgi:hypothetical protein
MDLLSKVKVVDVADAAAAGTSLITGNTIDTQGFLGIMCIAKVGDVTATCVPHLQAFEGDASNGSDATLLTGTSALAAAGASNYDSKMMILDVRRPLKRYITFKLVRGTANAVVDSLTGILYAPKDVPVTQGSDVIGSTSLLSPSE